MALWSSNHWRARRCRRLWSRHPRRLHLCLKAPPNPPTEAAMSGLDPLSNPWRQITQPVSIGAGAAGAGNGRRKCRAPSGVNSCYQYPGEYMRAFPLSNWTEMDLWEYIRQERLEVPSNCFTHTRECFRRGGQWLPVPPSHTDAARPDPYARARPRANAPVKSLVVRVRTIADMISTGMIESPASSVDDIVAEVVAARVTERGSRADDKPSEAAMEDRKKAGYF
ncbi:MAG: phosphoadenosine phosphosulfate reductase family protein [Verrucomicrobiae bacterium]|nr:phosphoadenosine phosphosulfate reductase family protein [Verrucomicrobiae bacterium]